MRRCACSIGLFWWLFVLSEAHPAEVSIRKETKIVVGPHELLFQSNSWFSWPIFPARDGGFLINSENFNGDRMLTRLDASRRSIWSTVFVGPNSWIFRNGLEATDGSFVFATWSRQLVVVNTNGIAGSIWLPEGRFELIARSKNGYIVAGELSGPGPQGAIIGGLGPNFELKWLNRTGSIQNDGQARGIAPVGDDSYVLATRSCGMTLTKAGTNGVVKWEVQFRGTDGCDEISSEGLLPLRDGGFLLACGSTSKLGNSKQAEFFGGLDVWLVKIDSAGREVWQRSFGGAGYDQFESVREVEDGGFVLCATSQQSGISGNKGVDGDGIWILKLNSRGIKESETILAAGFNGLIDRGSSLSLVTTPALGVLQWTNLLRPLTFDARVHLSINNPSGESYGVDSSLDLQSWSPLVTKFSGDLEFSDPTSGPARFYRVVDR